jgi:lincosamide nucleotidyltransferase A/C/D/E
MMSAADVLDVTSRMSAAGLSFWLDGGWCVDALIGEETRLHDDLDLVIRLEDSPHIVEVLGESGFGLELDDRPTRFVLASGDRRVDFHPIISNPDGSARQVGAGPNGGDATFPADGFTGKGAISGVEFRCLSPRLLVLFHTGYSPQQKDWHNVRLLCDRFGIPIPAGFESFRA